MHRSEYALVTFKPDIDTEQPTITYIYPAEGEQMNRQDFKLQVRVDAPAEDIIIGRFQVEIHKNTPECTDPHSNEYSSSECRSYIGSSNKNQASAGA